MDRSVPAPGQVVQVRRHHFVVKDCVQSAPLVDPLRPDPLPPEHLLTLSSVEDDAPDQDLQVIWELEPGAQVLERVTLPDPAGGFDAPRRLDAFLDAIRWGTTSSADHRALHSPFRSGITIEDYQLEPVVRALQMPRACLLIADDVGIGKTIEAGLVAQELLLRHRARSILVVCPASLQIQWRDQMRDKFGLEFRIVDSDAMKDLRRRRGIRTNPWNHFPRLITSMDFLKRDRPLRLFREALPPEGEPTFPRRFDLLIVDEAHNVAPSGTGNYATDSLRTAAIRTLAPHFEHKLFLTATPHNGYTESFSALLELVDHQRFIRGTDIDPLQLRAVMVRRMKSELERRWDGERRFAHRQLEPLEVAYTPEEESAHQLLREYTRSRLERARAHVETFGTEFVLKLLKKRLFSSPAAFADTLAKHEAAVRTSAASPAASERPNLSMAVLRRHVDQAEEDYAGDERKEEAAAGAIEATSRVFAELTPHEQELLGRLHSLASKAAPRPDSKARMLLDWLAATVKPRGKWNDCRVLLFTEYRATQKWLLQHLATEGFNEEGRLLTLYGGMPAEDRERIKAAFQADPKVSPVRILLATDAASEGIDLQNHCSRLVHYEIPWNPNRMEQRNGRLDRHGQRAEHVLVYHFVGKGFDREKPAPAARPDDLAGDLEFLMRAALKIETIREDLGKVGPVIAEQVEEAMLGRRRALDTRSAERAAEPVRRMLKLERDLRELVKQLHDQLAESRKELRVEPANIQTAVQVALELAGQPPLRRVLLRVAPSDPGRAGETFPAFHLPPMGGSWGVCGEGLAHPHTGEIRPIVFDHNLAAGRDDVVLAHLHHRLVQMCLRLLREELWSLEGRQGGKPGLHRVTARVVPDAVLDAPALVAHARLVVLGADNRRLHEEVLAAGGFLREGRFARMNVGQTEAALKAATDDEPSAAVKSRFAKLWSSVRPSLLQALDARMKDRTANLEKKLSERAEKEVDDLTAVLNELARTIRAELEAEPPKQLEIWEDPEKEQRQRNHEVLAARLASIPKELEREACALRARYARPAPRLFPVAVTLLVPAKLARDEGGRR
ncbi:MAG: DEAD/DEAH box helicase [Planctomycetes bacterium]|nr:DEAD/DEAH box helicase [Planctomycetota bacterium]